MILKYLARETETMTFHDLGTLGTADVIHRKSLTVRINMPWEQFLLKFAPELADLSAGTIAVLQEALISKKDVKIKKEGDELDKFFTKVEVAQKTNPYGNGKEHHDVVAEFEAPQKTHIDENAILGALSNEPMDIRDIIIKLGIADMSEARYLQNQLRTLETNDKLIVEIKQGIKLYRNKKMKNKSVSILSDREELQRAQEAHKKEELKRQLGQLDRQKAEEEHQRVEEEHDRINRLKELVEISIRLNRRDIGQYIGLSGDDLFRRLVKWAKEFGFKLDGEDVVFGGGRKDEFIARLEKEFVTWGKEGKK